MKIRRLTNDADEVQFVVGAMTEEENLRKRRDADVNLQI
jgi:hypothetical protein